MSTKFKVGDKVKCVDVSDDRGLPNRNYEHLLNKTGVVNVAEGEFVEVIFDDDPGREMRMFARRFRFLTPGKFGLDVHFKNVDDAIAAATFLAAHLNKPVGVKNV